LAVIGGKWKPLILFHLAHGARRYGELRRAVGGVTDKVLIQQLKELQADRIIDRLDYKEIPPKVEYSLTKFGSTLAKALAPLCVWGTEHLGEVEKLHRAAKLQRLPRPQADLKTMGRRVVPMSARRLDRARPLRVSTGVVGRTRPRREAAAKHRRS
jgi:DNA-binding HxlR family transcriptional regulator